MNTKKHDTVSLANKNTHLCAVRTAAIVHWSAGHVVISIHWHRCTIVHVQHVHRPSCDTVTRRNGSSRSRSSRRSIRIQIIAFTIANGAVFVHNVVVVVVAVVVHVIFDGSGTTTITVP